jgi:hypothetical protein
MITPTTRQKKNLFADDKIDKVVTKIIGGLSKIEDTYYAGRGLIFMNIEAEEVYDIQVTNVPSIVYFKNGHPAVYEGKQQVLWHNIRILRLDTTKSCLLISIQT